MRAQSGAGFNEPDFRSMSIHILNIIIPMVFIVLLAGVLSGSDDRVGHIAPILLLFGANLSFTALQKREPYRKMVRVTVLRFCVSFPLLCWLAALSRETPYACIFFLPQCFAIPFSFLMPVRTWAVLSWNAATLAFLWWLEKRAPGLFPIASLSLISLISWSGAWILERNLGLIQMLPPADRGKWGRSIGNQAIISYLVLIAGVGLTLVLFRNELDHRRQAAFTRLRAQSEAGVRNLDQRLAEQRSALDALAAFFDGSHTVERSEFDVFAARMLRAHPYIKALEWAPRVTQRERPRFEAEVGAEFSQPYHILRPDSGLLVPSPLQPDYFPIRFVFPFQPNRRVWGMDVASTPERKASIDRAFVDMAYTIRQPFKLTQDPLGQWTAVAFMPVRKGEAQGIAVALINLEKLARELIIDPLPRDFSVDLAFLSDTGWVNMLASGPKENSVRLEKFSDLVGGTRFRATINAPDSLVESRLDGLDAVLLAMGIITSIMLAYFMFHARKASLPLEIKVLERTLELQSVVIRAEEASQAKSRFLAQMSHEIRTPMNGVLGMSEALLHSNIAAEARASVELIKASGLSLLSILNDILDLSKIESGKMQLDVRPFQLGRLVSESVGIMKFDAGSQGIALILKATPPVPDWVSGDPLRVGQILMNLLNNALKFTPKGSVTVTHAYGPEGRFQLHIVDTGIGISNDKLARLFQPFEQGDSSTPRNFGGTGLGLAISLQFARMMGGDIDIRSREGVGTDICLTLLLPPTQAPVQMGKEAPARLRRGGRVLLAEDNHVNVRVAKALLEDYFERIDVAGNGREALRMLAGAEYEMILMDLQMPEMDGLQATVEIRKRPEWRAIPIIALTANAFSSDRKDCLAAGMQDFLVKPITIAGLHRVLGPYLGVLET